MSGSVTLLQLRTSAKDRANMEKSTLVSDAQWTEYINKSKDSLYDLLISAYNDEYYVSTNTFSLVSGTDSYALPSDFYKAIAVSLKSGNDYLRLRKFSFQDRLRNEFYPNLSDKWSSNYTYRITGNNVLFNPTPSSTSQIELVYIPLAVNLSSDSDALKGFNGWEEYIIIDAAIKALRKEETDTQELERDLARITIRLQEMADSRDIGQPAKIIDTSRHRGVLFYE
jgi:hypothetical protein